MRTRCLVRPGVTLVLGKTYTGKSTLIRRELTKRPSGSRAFIFDPAASDALDGLPEIRTRSGARRFLTGDASRGGWIRAVRFADPLDYAWLASTVNAWRGVTWVLDDAARLMRLEAIRDAAAIVAVSGRHMGGGAGVELWCVCHRPTNVHPDVRAQIERVYSFTQTEPRDVAQLADWCGSEFASRVAALPPGDWIAWPWYEEALRGRAPSRAPSRRARKPARRR